MNLDFPYVIPIVKGLTLLVVALLALRVRIKAAVVAGVAVLAGVFVVLIVYSLFVTGDPHVGIDYGFFREAGCDILAAQNPIDAENFGRHPFLNPPTSYPLFALFALFSFRTGYVLWTCLNLLACVCLVPLAKSALAEQQRRLSSSAPVGGMDALPDRVVLALVAALVISDASLLTLGIGQLSILVAFLLVAALAAQAREQPITAGVLLALATIKVGTMLPFLLLFLRWADVRTWIALIATTLALCLATVPATEFPARMRTMLDRVGQLEAPGQVNDYSFAGTRPENMLSFAHAWYCVGMRDRHVIRLGEYAAVGLLGVWVARQVVGRGRLPRAAACALVAVCAPLFLYHRAYDTVVLAPALVFSVTQARLTVGLAHWLFAACALALLLVVSINVDLLREVTQLSMTWGIWGRVVQALLLPYGTWLLVLAMVLLVTGTRISNKRSGMSPKEI